MKHIFRRKVMVFGALVAGMLVMQSFVQQHHEEKPQNLKILPKDISEEELHTTMRNYSKSLGVKCNYCHVSQEVLGQTRPKFDFPADDKVEKKIAREMMKMTESINNKYLGKIADGKLERITCVTCHNGNAKPNVSVDSMAKK